MLITVEQAVKIDGAIEKFFKAIGRKERILNRINRLAEENYKSFLPKVRAWMEFTNKEINKAFSKKYIRKFVEFQKDKAIDITTKLLDWEKLDEAGKRMLKPAGLDIMAKSGNEAYKIAGIEASFDILNPEAVKAVDRICSKLVTQVNKETKQAINEVIREGIKEGKSMGRVAKELRPLVGLTERQAKAVGNYEKWLEKHRPDLSALKRADWVKRYNNKLHRYRTDMIARTESMRATNEGNLIGYKEAGYKTVRWSANVGACPQCDAESGHVYTIEESRGMLPAHPDCRCSWLPESKAPKPKVPREVLRRSHLKKMSKSDSMNLMISDAKAKGIALSQEEAIEIREAMTAWTSQDYYRFIRVYQSKGEIALREAIRKAGFEWGGKGFTPKKIEAMVANTKKYSKAMEKYISISNKYLDQNVYRGIYVEKPNVAKLSKIFKEGATQDMYGTSSWSSSLKQAREKGNVIFKVKNGSGASIRHMTKWTVEDELIFSKNIKFKILNVEKFLDIDGIPYYIVNVKEMAVIPKPLVPKVPKWKPTMTKAEADLWAKGSVYADDVLYHGTNTYNASAIEEKGFALKQKTVGGKFLGDGVYITTDKNIALQFESAAKLLGIGEGKTLPLKINIKNPYIINDLDDLNSLFEILNRKNIALKDAPKYLQSIDYDAIDARKWQADYGINIFDPKNITIIEGK